jgi:predicted polyphosphate/ATP-dependent NAD kinase
VTLAERSGAVGIIANPASGKDIRRLVAQATTIGNQEKLAIVRRVILGLAGAGVARALLMPDPQGLARQAARLPQSAPLPLPEIAWVDVAARGTAEDSRRAAAQMAAEPVGCIVTLGGDGTVRAVSQGAGETPLLALSTGTNNVLPTFLEATVAGLAAGAVARGRVALPDVAYRHKWLEVSVDGHPVDRALVDVALLRGRFVGARAVWEPGSLLALAVTRADPATIGVSAIAGALCPIGPRESRGLAVWLAPDASRRIIVPLGPGLLAQVGIAATQELRIDQELRWPIGEHTIVALDGERELALAPGQQLGVRLRADGPWIVEGSQVMRALAQMDSTHSTEQGEAP